jgi:hypothetical protein
MKITRRPDGDVEMMLPGDELYGLRQCLNEPTNGYNVPNFEERIGVSRDTVNALLDATARRGGSKITAINDDCFRFVATPADCRVILTCMRDTLNGQDLMPTEYQTRVGIEAVEVQTMILKIEAALAGNPPTAIGSMPNPS